MTHARACLAAALLVATAPPIAAQNQDFLRWSSSEAQKIGRELRADGRVGGLFDLRGLDTDRSYNYKLRATWLTREVIRATARLAQIENRLTNVETEALVAEAEVALAGRTAVLIEIDPREGSGVIPREWVALLRPRGVRDGEASGVRGEFSPALGKVRALAGIGRCDYAYDVFWVSFPLSTEAGTSLFANDVKDAELVVRIYDKEGRVRWPIPASIRSSPN